MFSCSRSASCPVPIRVAAVLLVSSLLASISSFAQVDSAGSIGVRLGPFRERPSEIFWHSAFSVTSDEKDLLEYEVLEDSDDKFAVKITKCKYADFYLDRGASEIGYRMHCALDFGETEAFSSEITLKRTKTLMQGDNYCNHCYELKQYRSSI